MQRLNSSSGQGAEIRALLEDALGIPKDSKWFEVRFAREEPISVTCEFYSLEVPAEPDTDPADPPPPHVGGSLDD